MLPLQELIKTPPKQTEMTKQFFSMFDRRAALALIHASLRLAQPHQAELASHLLLRRCVQFLRDRSWLLQKLAPLQSRPRARFAPADQ